jgi:hypothetical protein
MNEQNNIFEKIDIDKYDKENFFIRLYPVDKKHGTEFLIRMKENDLKMLKEKLNI